MLHRPPSFKRSQNRVGVDGSPPEDLVAKRVREGVQDGGTTAPYGRLAHTAGADRRFRIRNIQRCPLNVQWNCQAGWVSVVVKPLGNHCAVMGVEDPLLADRMANAKRRPAENLAAERTRVDHSPYIGVREEVQNVVLTGFDIDFDLGETRHIGMGHAVPRVVVAGGSHQSLAGQCRDGCLSRFVDVRWRFVAIVLTAEFNSALSGPGKSHPRAVPLPEDTLIRDRIILGFTAQALRCDVLEFLRGIHCHRVSSTGHCMRRLAAAGHTCEGKMLRRVAPDNIALFPWDAENLRGSAVNVDHRFRSQISNSRLESDATIGGDDEKSVEPSSATDVAAE